MALGDPYATRALLKTRINDVGTANDAAYDSALAASSAAIEGFCGRQFNDAGSATARVYYPDDLVTVIVDDFSTTTGFLYDVDYSNAGTYSSNIPASQYQLEPLNGVVDGTTGWPYYRIRAIQTWNPLWYTSIGFPRASIRITARWGWAAVPSAVVEACLMLSEETFKMKDAPFGVMGFADYGLIRVRENPKVAAMLARYRRDPIQIA